jgi:hypothetical protein
VNRVEYVSKFALLEVAAMCLIPRLERNPRIAALGFVDDAEGRLLSDAALPVSEASEPGREDRYLWTGREWDTDTRLMYNRARWYDPSRQPR